MARRGSTSSTSSRTPRAGGTRRRRPAAARARRALRADGYAFQNEYKEIFSLFTLITGGAAFRTEYKDFKSFYEDPIQRGYKQSASDETKALGLERMDRLKQKIDRFMLRRDKSALGDLLKGKDDIIVRCQLAPLQRALYERALQLPDFALVARAKDPCGCGREGMVRGKCCYVVPTTALETELGARAELWRKQHPDGQACKLCPSCMALPCVAKLQKISNHPELLLEDLRWPDAKRADVAAFARLVYPPAELAARGGSTERSQRFADNMRADVCGKLGLLEALLNKFKRTRSKALVFSLSVQMLDILEAFVISRGYSFSRLDGATSQRERQALVDEFNRDATKKVFLISTRAGGVGLNLQSASRVVIFDVNWNPSYDLQAQDRAYRSQQKRVKVYRFMSQGTIEELTYLRQLYKQQLRDAGLHGSAALDDAPLRCGQGRRGGEGRPLRHREHAPLLGRQPRGGAAAAAGAGVGGGVAAAGSAAAGSRRRPPTTRTEYERRATCSKPGARPARGARRDDDARRRVRRRRRAGAGRRRVVGRRRPPRRRRAPAAPRPRASLRASAARVAPRGAGAARSERPAARGGARDAPVGPRTAVEMVPAAGARGAPARARARPSGAGKTHLAGASRRPGGARLVGLVSADDFF